jgi:DNA-binding SARP family transcriptional activator/TolB-like protein
MIEIRTLGRTCVSVDGQPLADEAAWPRSLALVVYMAREPGPDRREEILSVLWPDRDEKRARRALNQLLYTLRKSSPALDLESIEDAIDFGAEVRLDVQEFERRLDTGDARGAVELYQGPFLADLSLGEPEFDHWADRQRAGLARKFRRAALDLAVQARAAGEHDKAVSYCQRLVEHDSLDDEAQHLLIECLWLRGDRVGALRQYEEYRALLGRELEIEPLEQTRELVARIRAEPVPGAALGEPETLAGEGEVRGKKAVSKAAARGPAGKWRLIRSRGALLGLGAVAVVVVLALSLWPESASDRSALVASSGAAATGERRIAVLPFRAHGLDLADSGLEEGVAQLLTLELGGGGGGGGGGAGGATVIGHRAVVELWQRSGPRLSGVLGEDEMRGIARDLGADAVVIGDLHVSGDELRLVAELVDARTGLALAQGDVRGARDALFDLIGQLAASLLGRSQPNQEVQ